MIKLGYSANESVVNEGLTYKRMSKLTLSDLKNAYHIYICNKDDTPDPDYRKNSRYTRSALSDKTKWAFQGKPMNGDRYTFADSYTDKELLDKINKTNNIVIGVEYSTNESLDMNESALSVSKYDFNGGTNKPFHDGSAKGDLEGKNSAIEVYVSDQTGVEADPYAVIVYIADDEDADCIEINKWFKNGKDAIKFAEKLLKETKGQSMLDGKKFAKKYGMNYLG